MEDEEVCDKQVTIDYMRKSKSENLCLFTVEAR